MYASTESTLWKWRETRWPGLLINKLAKCTTHLPDKSIITLDNTKILWKIIIRTFVYGLWVMFLFLRENNPIKTEITWLHLTQHCKHKELGKSRLVYESAAPQWVSVWNHWIVRALCIEVPTTRWANGLQLYGLTLHWWLRMTQYLTETYFLLGNATFEKKYYQR